MSDKQLPKFKDYAGQPVNFIQPKLDGHYTKVVKDAAGSITATSKKPKDITEKLLAINHIRHELDAMLNDSIILCELHCPSVDATSVPTMLNAVEEKLLLTVFAVPRWNGHNWNEWPPEDNDLCDLMIQMAGLGFSAAYAVNSLDFVDEKGCNVLNELAVRNKFEGHVLKVSHMAGWYKLKPVRTLDAVVVETFMSTCKSYWGNLQGVRVVVYNPDGTEFNLGCVGIGVKKEKLKYNTIEKRETLINRVCECEYDKIGAKGGMRFPRWKRWRDDEKSPEECTTDQFNYYKGKMICK